MFDGEEGCRNSRLCHVLWVKLRDWRFGLRSAEALNLLKRMLVFNPKKRISIDECLAHPFFEEIRNTEIEVGGQLASANSTSSSRVLSETTSCR